MEQFVDLKYLLLKKFSYVEELSLKEAQEKGCAGGNLTIVTRILTIITNGDYSISAIAKMIGISRQAAHKNISELVDSGHAVLKDDETNKRIKIVKITQEGEKLLKVRRDLLEKIQKKIEKNIGKKSYDNMIEILQKKW